MAAGVPVVTTPVGVAAQAIRSGVSGFVTGDFEPCTIASAILAILSMGLREYAAMSRNARADVAKFGVESMIDQTRNLYLSLIDRRRKRAATA